MLDSVLFPNKETMFMVTNPDGKVKPLTAEVLIKGDYVGGQVQIKSFREPTRRGEILEFVFAESLVRIRLAFAARKYDDGWREDPVSEYTIRLPICQYKEGVGADIGVIMVDYPYLDVAMTFFPKRHRRNIRLEDVKPKPY